MVRLQGGGGGGGGGGGMVGILLAVSEEKGLLFGKKRTGFMSWISVQIRGKVLCGNALFSTVSKTCPFKTYAQIPI